jgi:MoxR-like ATPase
MPHTSGVDGDATVLVPTVIAALAAPGLVVVAGPPGIGRTTVVRRVGEAFHGPAFVGGGLAALRGMDLT